MRRGSWLEWGSARRRPLWWALRSAPTATTRMLRTRARRTATTDRVGLAAASLSARVRGSMDSMGARASSADLDLEASGTGQSFVVRLADSMAEAKCVVVADRAVEAKFVAEVDSTVADAGKLGT